MKLAGVDLAWCPEKNPTAIAEGILDERHLRVSSVDVAVRSVNQIFENLLSDEEPDGIAIDASLIIPNDSGQRDCEKQLSSRYGAMGASCHASNTTLYPEAASVTLSQKLSSKGFGHLDMSKWQVECYPHPAIIEIFGLSRRLAYKKGRVADRKAGQKHLAHLLKTLSASTVLSLELTPDVSEFFDEDHVDSLSGRGLKSNEDALDAVVCLYIAGLYSIQVPGQTFGNVDNGYIWVPQVSALPTDHS